MLFQVDNPCDGSGGVYTGANNKETVFPIGHELIAWVGSEGYVQSYINKHTTVYLSSKDVDGYMRYTTPWYGNLTGEPLAGVWQYRGYCSTLNTVKTGFLVRVK